HELRTPLTSIRGYLHLLKAETSGLAKAHQSVLDRAISSTEQLSSLVSRLLEVSQIEQRELKLEKAVVTWSDVIVQIRDMYSPMAKSDKWHLTVQEPAQQCLVEVDQKRIIQVF